MRRLPLGLLLSLFCLPALAGVYTYIDADGNRVFTDQPPSGHAERIELAPANDMSATRTAPPAPPQPIDPEASYQVLRILVPEPDAVIRDMAGNLIISATSEPTLHPGHNFRLILDGKPASTAGRSPVFPLENIDRGTHQVSVEIVDAAGRIVERTPSQPFHMKRTSLNEKRAANPCKKKDWGVRPECPIEDKPKEPDKGIISILPFVD
ncbi:DUF4124 domain-containing protein [Pseudomonas sp. Gutcm_11s]|uniref:DUF4124 domain-containing protein n=1 Tax=Pseudomonas sp. Gutcm_11s TaxID=3026088 RepID=UPI0023621170|nr:DUF4124 domain-containing protein [Pseudomonas sp. Gutcm_11s]MDD0845227.1 DUF4124 domain-containing protein [Pseudomonas sp. Gutcm_11s]